MSKKKKKNNSGILTKGSCDTIILIVTIILVSLGLIMVLSASSPSSLSESGDSYKYFRRQLIATIAGMVALVILSRYDYHRYKKFKWLIYIVLVIILLLVGIIGVSSGGAKRWIIYKGVNFQPSEFAKLGFIIFFAAILSDLKEKKQIDKPIGFWKPFVLIAIPSAIIYFIQNHFSATLVICLITCIQMFVAGVSIKYFIVMLFVGACAMIVFLLKGNTDVEGSFRGKRIQTWLRPFDDPTGNGWQIIQSLYAIASGGLFGAGLGESKQKYLYLPEPQNDFIFSVLAEELGFFGCAAVIILFIVFIWRGIVIAMKSKDTFGCLIAVGIVALIGIEAVINIAVVTGTVPVTGMPLPFFSYGGTSMVINLAAVGILLNISRSSKK